MLLKSTKSPHRHPVFKFLVLVSSQFHFLWCPHGGHCCSQSVDECCWVMFEKRWSIFFVLVQYFLLTTRFPLVCHNHSVFQIIQSEFCFGLKMSCQNLVLAWSTKWKTFCWCICWGVFVCLRIFNFGLLTKAYLYLTYQKWGHQCFSHLVCPVHFS